MKQILLAHENIYFTVFRPSQASFAWALPMLRQPYGGTKLNYYDYMAKLFEENRDAIYHYPKYAVTWEMLKPEGGYFILADITKVLPQVPIKYFYKSR